MITTETLVRDYLEKQQINAAMQQMADVEYNEIEY